jgi:hypothetical protein
MFISFFVKLIELVTLIFSTSYFFLITWVLLCEFLEDFIIDTEGPVAPGLDQDDGSLYFFPYYGLHELSLERTTLNIFYFAFTSLTTVGFGDYHPISSMEQLLCGFMLLFGVLIFSYIMNEYIALLDSYKEHTKEFDEHD